MGFLLAGLGLLNLFIAIVVFLKVIVRCMHEAVSIVLSGCLGVFLQHNTYHFSTEPPLFV